MEGLETLGFARRNSESDSALFWLEEITAEEAAAIVAKREKEMASKEETQEPEETPPQ